MVSKNYLRANGYDGRANRSERSNSPLLTDAIRGSVASFLRRAHPAPASPGPVHQPPPLTARGFGLCMLLLTSCVATLFTSVSHAQTYTVNVDPIFLYQDSYFNPPTPWEASLAQTWADVQANKTYNYCTTYPSGASYCQNVTNLHADPNSNLLFNNSVYFSYYFDLYDCSTPAGGGQPVCNTASNWSVINSEFICPPGFSGVQHAGTDSNPRHDTVWCQATFPVAQPPPRDCKSCIGNPIYASTGQKLQVETDYAGMPGLSYSRTYRSTLGLWSSSTSRAFIDYSQPNATLTNNCFLSYYVDPNTQANVARCFPYISLAQTNYQLLAADGRNIQFSGPLGSITQNADINERVTQIVNGGVTEWQITREDNSVELYNTAGSLLQKTLLGGEVITYTYSTSSTPSSIAPRPGLLISQSDPFGHTLSWQYNAAAQVVKMIDPAGGIYQYNYDGTGNLTGVTYPGNSSKVYSYNESADTGGTNLPNAMTGITDESNIRFATFHYDSSGRGTSSEHAGGVDKYTLSYNGTYAGAPATVTDPLGTNRTYQFSALLSAMKDTSQAQPAASGGSTVTQTETYDANGNVASLTDFNGNLTCYAYDLTRNLETVRVEGFAPGSSCPSSLATYTPASGTRQRKIVTSWHPSFRLPATITEFNRTTTLNYDGNGNLQTKTVTDTSVTPNVSRTWSYTYDSYGRMKTAKGPRTDVDTTTTYAYYTCATGYQCGKLQTVTDALGHITTYNTYNAHGQPLTITDPNNVVTTLQYDGRQRLTSRQIGTETTTFDYWPTGLLKKVTLPDASNLTYTYDNAHRLTQITDGLGNNIVYTPDAMGNHTADHLYDPSGVLHRTHSRVINALNQLYQDINAAGTAAVTTTFGYDNNGNQTSSQAPLGRNTSNQYDELNRLTQITDPANAITRFGYDANGNLTSVTDPRNLPTSYIYNGFGDLKTQASPDTGTAANTYDSGGNLFTSTDARGALATYSYDALNRIRSVAYSKGGTTDQTITFTYDQGSNGIGHLTGAADASHSLSWTYDGLGRVTSRSQTVGGLTALVRYGYTNGDLTTLTTPTGQAIGYTYTNHQVTSITVNGATLLSSVKYEPLGPANGWTFGNGTVVTRTYDTDGKISQISSAGVKTYSYDNAFRITGITDTTTGGVNWTYGYDPLDRITSSNRTGTTRGWTYDANGNRLTETGTYPSTYTISTTSNRITSITGQVPRTYSYDNAGNVQGYASVTAGYNDRGRLQGLTNGGSTASFIYNALGQMAQSNGTAGFVLYAYDEAGHLIGEYDGAARLIEETVWLGDIPVATLRPSGSTVAVYYVHSDHLHTPHVVTRPSDNKQMWTWFSDAFGLSAANSNPQGAGTFTYNLRFPGQIFNGTAGLHQNYFRDYDPAVGRYVESDALGLKAGINTYGYVSDNPLSNVDPMGLCDGKWVKMGETIRTLPIIGLWQNYASNSCACWWACMPCQGAVAWDGNIYRLPKTVGSVVVVNGGGSDPGTAGLRPTPAGPSGAPSATMGGKMRCVCEKPSRESGATNETGCTFCYKDSAPQVVSP
jgi:RHS repeat-associated protein